MIKKENCWEYNRCGREPGGANAVQLGLCPAATDSKSTGMNGGKSAGRICWKIAGTMCDFSEIHGTFAMRLKNCEECEFYKKVIREEGSKIS